MDALFQQILTLKVIIDSILNNSNILFLEIQIGF